MTKFFQIFKSIPRPFALAILSGFFVGTSYIPFPGWALFFCYTPLWVATVEESKNLSRINYKKIFFLGWISQFILTLIGFNWIYYTASEFGLLHWSLSAAAVLLFAAFMHLYIPFALVLSAFLFSRFKISNKLAQFLLIALTLSFLERIWPSIFEWNLAYALLWMKWPIYQWADTVGFWGLSTWLMLFQAVFSYAAIHLRSNFKLAAKFFSLGLLALLIFSVLGLRKEKKWSGFDQQIQVGVIQGNVGNADKIQSEQKQNYQMHILNLYSGLTEKLLVESPQTEIILWPETAMPFPLDYDFLNRNEQSQLLTLVEKWKKPVITGGYSVDLKQKDHLGYYLMSNSVFFLGPGRKLLTSSYDKTDLLVFGEYMPFGKQLPFLYKLLPFVGNFKIGPGPSVKEINLISKNIRFGPQICYESLNSKFSRGLANKGSQILFNVTNDSWYGSWAEPYQHQIMTLGRAIEVRRPLIRSTNTGITSAILANGQILENSPIDQSWAHTYKIDYVENPETSFYTQIGYLDWIFWLLIYLFIIFYFQKKGKNASY